MKQVTDDNDRSVVLVNSALTVRVEKRNSFNITFYVDTNKYIILISILHRSAKTLSRLKILISPKE